MCSIASDASAQIVVPSLGYPLNPTERDRVASVTVSHDKIADLVVRAIAARERAVADYSGFKVGAALLTDADEIFTGCNIENDSFGLTVCAERVAVYGAIANSKRRPIIRAVAVAVGSGSCGVPCGACLQVISMFGAAATISYQPASGERVTCELRDLLPFPFGLSS